MRRRSSALQLTRAMAAVAIVVLYVRAENKLRASDDNATVAVQVRLRSSVFEHCVSCYFNVWNIL